MRERERYDGTRRQEPAEDRVPPAAGTRERANELLRAADGIIERALAAGDRDAFMRATRQESGE